MGKDGLNSAIALTPNEIAAVERMIRAGVYKALHKQEFLTEEQLISLLQQNNLEKGLSDKT